MHIPARPPRQPRGDGAVFVAAVAAVGLLATLLATAPTVQELVTLVQQQAAIHTR